MTPSDSSTVLPETAAAERLRQHLQEIADERDKAHRALQEREAELARIQRIGRVGGVEVDFRDGFKNRRSPEYLIIHGLPPDATNETHEDWVERIHPDDRERTVKQFLDALAGRDEDYTASYRIIRPSDGQTRWIDVIAKIERDSEGRALRLVGAHIDATDRMLAQEKLRESEERFRLIADSAPVPMWVTKLDRTRSFANQAYVDFLGLPFEEAIAFDWRKRLHPDDQQRVVQQSIAGEASLKPFVLEARYRDASGEYRWLRSESQPRWDPTGKHIGFIGVAHDITAAKQAEHDLRQLNEILELRITERTAQLESNEAQMRAILETSHQYQGLLNLHGDLLFANKTALAGIRTEASAVLGKPFWETPWFSGTEGMGDAVRDAFIAVMRGEEVQIEMLLRLPIGERYFDFTMRPLRDQHGAIIGAVPDAIDVTERRQSEEALRQSQKMEAVGQLTGGVAHDFNNLLTIIRSATDFLRRRELPEERRRRYIDAISETVERASKLTAQLLAFARRQPLKPQVFNVGTQAEAVAQLIRPLVGGRIRIDVEIADSNCFAIADIAQFETALINLAVNSRDAMNSEGRLIIGVRKVHASLRCAPSPPAAASSSPSPWRIPAAASRPSCSRRSSNRSSPPRKSARAPASASARRSALPSNPTATSRSQASPARARRSRSICRRPRCRPMPSRPPPRRANPPRAAAATACSWSRTMTTSDSSPPSYWKISATRSAASPARMPRSPSWPKTSFPPIWCFPTSSCPA